MSTTLSRLAGAGPAACLLAGMTACIASAFSTPLTAQGPLSTFANNGPANNGLGVGDGVYFDLDALSASLFLSEIHIETSSTGTLPQISIYTCTGPWTAQQNNPAAWSLVGTHTGAVPAAGSGALTPIDIPDLQIPQGITGVYLVYENVTLRYYGSSSAPAPGSVATSELSLVTGASDADPTPGLGISNSPRQFMGEIRYYPAAGLFPSVAPSATTGSSPLAVGFKDTTYSSDPNGVLLVELDFDNDGVFDANTPAGGTVNHTYGCGDFSVSVRALDSLHGQVTRVYTDLVQVDDFHLAFDPLSGFASAGVPVQFSYNGDPIASLLWDFDGDAIADATGSSPSFAFPQPGSYQITLTGIQGCRQKSISGNMTIVDQVLDAPAGGGGFTSFVTPPDAAYFDLTVASAVGITVTAMGARSPRPGELHAYEVWGNVGNSAANNFAFSNFTLLGSGQWTPAVADALELVDVSDFSLPAGTHGIAIVHRAASGSAPGHTWYLGNVGMTSSDANLTISPLGSDSDFNNQTSNTGISSTSNSFAGSVFYSVGGMAPPPGTVTKFGDGCPGSLGTPGIAPGASPPAQGNLFSVKVTNVAGGTSLHGGTSNSNNATFGVPLPFQLGPVIGVQKTCFFRVSSEAIFPLMQPNAFNEATFSFPIPNNPLLNGLATYFQALTFDGTVPGNLVVSDAWLAVVQ